MQGSGYTALDDEAMALVMRAQSMPALPQSMTEAGMSLTVPIRSLQCSRVFAPVSEPSRCRHGERLYSTRWANFCREHLQQRARFSRTFCGAYRSQRVPRDKHGSGTERFNRGPTVQGTLRDAG